MRDGAREEGLDKRRGVGGNRRGNRVRKQVRLHREKMYLDQG